MTRNLARMALIVLATIGLALAAGCRMDFDVATTVLSPDSLVESTTLSIEMPQEMLDSLSEAAEGSEAEPTAAPSSSFGDDIAKQMQPKVTELQEQGYTVTQITRTNAYTLTMQRPLDVATWLQDKESINATSRVFTVTESDTERTYVLRLKVASQGESGTSPTSGLLPSSGSGQTEDELKQFFQMRLRWSVTLPGEITETNATAVAGNTATWIVDLSSSETPEEWFVTSVEKLEAE